MVTSVADHGVAAERARAQRGAQRGVKRSGVRIQRGRSAVDEPPATLAPARSCESARLENAGGKIFAATAGRAAFLPGAKRVWPGQARPARS
jgi:hypothetical protein